MSISRDSHVVRVNNSGLTNSINELLNYLILRQVNLNIVSRRLLLTVICIRTLSPPSFICYYNLCTIHPSCCDEIIANDFAVIISTITYLTYLSNVAAANSTFTTSRSISKKVMIAISNIPLLPSDRLEFLIL